MNIEKDNHREKEDQGDIGNENERSLLSRNVREAQSAAQITIALASGQAEFRADPISESPKPYKFPKINRWTKGADAYAEKVLGKLPTEKFERGRTGANYPLQDDVIKSLQEKAKNFNPNEPMVPAPPPGTPELMRLSMAHGLEMARRLLYKYAPNLRIVLYSAWRSHDRTIEKAEEAKGTDLENYLAQGHSTHEEGRSLDVKLTNVWGTLCSMMGYAQQNLYARLKEKFRGKRKEDVASLNDPKLLREYDQYLDLEKLQIGNEVLAWSMESCGFVNLKDPPESWHFEYSPGRMQKEGVIDGNADLSQFAYNMFEPKDPNNQTEVLPAYPGVSLYEELKEKKQKNKQDQTS